MEHDIRAKFETWYSDNKQRPKAIERSPDGWYKLMDASISFIAFQAGAEEAEKQRDELLVALIDTLDFVERHSNRWDGENGKHPATVVENARKAIANAKGA